MPGPSGGVASCTATNGRNLVRALVLILGTCAVGKSTGSILLSLRTSEDVRENKLAGLKCRRRRKALAV